MCCFYLSRIVLLAADYSLFWLQITESWERITAALLCSHIDFQYLFHRHTHYSHHSLMFFSKLVVVVFAVASLSDVYAHCELRKASWFCRVLIFHSLPYQIALLLSTRRLPGMLFVEQTTIRTVVQYVYSPGCGHADWAHASRFRSWTYMKPTSDATMAPVEEPQIPTLFKPANKLPSMLIASSTI